jgi:hypothetical protein
MVAYGLTDSLHRMDADKRSSEAGLDAPTPSNSSLDTGPPRKNASQHCNRHALVGTYDIEAKNLMDGQSCIGQQY